MCPLTKEPMVDPVSLVTGSCFERASITAWFAEGNTIDMRTKLISKWGVEKEAIAGLAADGRQIVTCARAEAGNYLGFYGEELPTKELCDRVAYYVHLCTLYWWLRPYGSAAILGGYDRDGPQLYMIEPSGVAYRYFGAAVGKGSAKTEIEKLKLSQMTCREGVIAVAKIIYNVHDEAKDKAFELEMSWICDESKREHQRVPADLLAEAKWGMWVVLRRRIFRGS
ncbi:20S proteasome subunit alpha 7 [Marchantia polymorpha subsp. ruderalis]